METINPNSKVEITYKELQRFEKTIDRLEKQNEVLRNNVKNLVVVEKETYYSVAHMRYMPSPSYSIVREESKGLIRKLFDAKENTIRELYDEISRATAEEVELGGEVVSLKKELKKIPKWIRKWYKVAI